MEEYRETLHAAINDTVVGAIYYLSSCSSKLAGGWRRREYWWAQYDDSEIVSTANDGEASVAWTSGEDI